MSYLLYVALFGAVAVIFLWLRDARIYYRTGLPGYRKAARYGVLYGALATLGFLIALLGSSAEVLGIGIVMAALFLRDRGTREKVWKDESTAERFLGSVRLRKK
ncbi:MAG: ABC transporter permease [Methanomicrobiales archaeon]